MHVYILVYLVLFVCVCTHNISGVSAIDVLRKGLEDLQTLCDHVLDTFQVSLTLEPELHGTSLYSGRHPGSGILCNRRMLL